MTSQLTLTDPGDLLAMTAYAFGYTPTESLVIIGLQSGPKTGGHLRVDLTPAVQAPTVIAGEYAPLFAQEHEACIILVFRSTEPTPGNGTEPTAVGALTEVLTSRMQECGMDVVGAWEIGGGYARPLDCSDADCCSYPGVPAVLTSEAAEAIAPHDETTPAQIAESFGAARANAVVSAEIAEADTSPEEGLQIWDAVMGGDLSADDLTLTTTAMAGMLAVLSDTGVRGLIATAAADLATGYGEMITTAEGLPGPADTTGPTPDWKRIDRLADALDVITPYADTTATANAYAVMGWVAYAKGAGTLSTLFLDQAERVDSGTQLLQVMHARSQVAPAGWSQSKATAYRVSQD